MIIYFINAKDERGILMLEKKFLEKIRKGKQINLDVFGEDVCDLLDWGIANSFIEGISYLGFGGKVNIQYTNPRLTMAGQEFLLSLERDSQEILVKPFDTDALLDKIKVLDEEQQEVIDRWTDNIHLLGEIKTLDEETLSTMKKVLLKMKFKDKELPWDLLIKSLFILKGNN